MKNFIEKGEKHEKSIENFEIKRRKGENDLYVCELIREDLLDDFISFVNKTNLSLNSTIKESIFEANPFLIKKNPTLIEYSAFFGSIKIFKYLYLNNVNLTENLWLYAIHGFNTEIIHLIEEKKLIKDEKFYSKCLTEAIKCHHNDIANYIKSNFIKNDIEDFENKICEKCLKYYNFEFLQMDHLNQNFGYLCLYDYFDLVELLIKNEDIDLNSTINGVLMIIKFE